MYKIIIPSGKYDDYSEEKTCVRKIKGTYNKNIGHT
jgi:hypothetical protein